MSGLITIPLHIGDFLSGTLHMDTLEKGAYIMLLLSHYQTGRLGLPNDDKKLARIAGVTNKVWMRIKPVMEEKFTVSDGFWVNKKVIDTLRKVEQKSSEQRAKALKRHNTGHATALQRQCQPKPKPNIEDTNVSSTPLPPKGALIPNWLSQNDWNDFLEMRKKIKKPATEKAKKLLIQKLEKYRARGIDTAECLRQSIINCWQDIYEPKGNKNEKPISKSTISDRADAAQARVLARYGITQDKSDHGVVPSVLRHSGHIREIP